MGFIYAVVGVPLIFFLGFSGSILPPITQKIKKNYDVTNTFIFRLLNGFASGVIVAVALVHSFPEGYSSLAENITVEYPFGGLFALIGAFITFTIESIVSLSLRRIHGVMYDHHSSSSSSSSNDGIVREEEMKERKKKKNDDDDDDDHDNDGGGDDDDDEVDMKKKENEFTDSELHEMKTKFYTEMYVLLFGLSFHSIFVGFALGLSNDDLGLFIAIIFHQFFEGIALGVRVARAKIKKSSFVIFIDFLFAIATPLGIVIGLWIKSSVINNPTTYEIVQGTFNTFSAGILVYVGLVHMLAEEVQRDDIQKSMFKYFTIYFGALLGAALMSILAIWA